MSSNALNASERSVPAPHELFPPTRADALERLRAFVAAAAEDAARAAASALRVPVEVIDALDSRALAERARAADATLIVTADAPVGPVDDGPGDVAEALVGSGVELRRVRRGWDEHAWSHATRGFFAFKKNIPALLEQAA